MGIKGKERREGRGRGMEGEEEREGKVSDENEGERGKERKGEEMQRGRLKEWECRRVEARGGGKLTRERVPTCLFRQMLSTDAVPSLLLIHSPPLPSPL